MISELKLYLSVHRYNVCSQLISSRLIPRNEGTFWGLILGYVPRAISVSIQQIMGRKHESECGVRHKILVCCSSAQCNTPLIIKAQLGWHIITSLVPRLFLSSHAAWVRNHLGAATKLSPRWNTGLTDQIYAISNCVACWDSLTVVFSCAKGWGGGGGGQCVWNLYVTISKFLDHNVYTQVSIHFMYVSTFQSCSKCHNIMGVTW